MGVASPGERERRGRPSPLTRQAGVVVVAAAEDNRLKQDLSREKKHQFSHQSLHPLFHLLSHYPESKFKTFLCHRPSSLPRLVPRLVLTHLPVLVLRAPAEGSRMYSFSKGQSRLFVKGSREVDDNDNITDPTDRHVTSSHSRLSHRDHGITSAEVSSSSKFESKSQMASASQESRELMRTNNVRSGLKTVHTQKVVRKTTTISLGEKKESTHVKVSD